MMKKRLTENKLLYVFLLMGLILSGCESLFPKPLAFETISKRDSTWPEGYSAEKPGLIVFANRKEIDDPRLKPQFAFTLAKELGTLDYGQVFAVMVFSGWVNTQYDYTIQQVSQQSNRVIIELKSLDTVRGPQIFPADVEPYHLIAISKKGGTFGKSIQFVLMRGNEQVAETTSFIP